MEPFQAVMCARTHTHMHSRDLPECVHLCADREACLAPWWCGGAVLVPAVRGMSTCQGESGWVQV